MVSKSDSDYSANVNWANKLVVKPAHTSRRMALILMQNAINMCVCCLDDGIQDKSSHGRLRKRKANQTFMIKEWVFLEGFYRNVFWVTRYFMSGQRWLWCGVRYFNAFSNFPTFSAVQGRLGWWWYRKGWPKNAQVKENWPFSPQDVSELCCVVK